MVFVKERGAGDTLQGILNADAFNDGHLYSFPWH